MMLSGTTGDTALKEFLKDIRVYSVAITFINGTKLWKLSIFIS